jgi:methionyl-tRNA formyltransferase
MRILFAGSGDIGVPSLRALIDHPRHEVVALVTQPDKPAGRGKLLTPPPTKPLALAAGIPVLQPAKIRDCADALAALQPDVAVVIAYGQILNQTVLDIPRHGCLNVHASLLPRHRGASPIQAAIREGDDVSGVTIMFMDAGLDTGDILLAESIPLDPRETGGSLHDKLALLAPGALLHALDLIELGRAPRAPQDDALATHCGKLTRADGRIKWGRSALEIDRLIRACDPWPGAHTIWHDAPLKIHAAIPAPGLPASAPPGTVLDAPGRLLVATGAGALEVLALQAQGAKRLPAVDFLRGHPVPPGAMFQA